MRQASWVNSCHQAEPRALSQCYTADIPVQEVTTDTPADSLTKSWVVSHTLSNTQHEAVKQKMSILHGHLTMKKRTRVWVFSSQPLALFASFITSRSPPLIPLLGLTSATKNHFCHTESLNFEQRTKLWWITGKVKSFRVMCLITGNLLFPLILLSNLYDFIRSWCRPLISPLSDTKQPVYVMIREHIHRSLLEKNKNNDYKTILKSQKIIVICVSRTEIIHPHTEYFVLTVILTLSIV